MKKNFPYKLILSMILIMCIPTPLAIDEYAASLPHMVKDLMTNNASVQFSISLYMLALSISQIIFGPLSDHYGRRPILLATMPIFLFATLFCANAETIHSLLIARFIQGLGIGACTLTASALITDVFSDHDLNRVTSYFSTVYSFVPITAPIIGGLIQDYFGWRSNFIFLFLFSLLAYLYFLGLLPETNPQKPNNKLNFKILITDYLTVLTHRRYMLSVLCLLLTWSMIISFSILAPFIMQISLGFSATGYGLLALLVGVGFMIGNLLNNYLISHISQSKLLNISLCIPFIMSLLFFSLTLAHIINIWSLMIPTFILMIGAGITFPNFYAIAVAAIPELAGTANALIGALILFGAVIVTSILTLFRAHSPLPLASTYLVLSITPIFFYFYFFEKESL